MMTWPNRLTVLRILLLTPFLILLLNAKSLPSLRYGALGVFALMALCDVLDGQLARRWRQRTPLGTLLDPLADKLVLTASVVLLTYPDWPGRETPLHIPLLVTVTLLSKDAVILLGVVIVHFITGKTDFLRPSVWGKATTATTFSLVLLMLLAPDVARVPGAETPLKWFVYGLGGAAAALAVVACLDYIRTGSKFIASHSGQEKV
jgi:CDP-diacylglycerol--glycerol-3-phosphate 3-phosphatidyltransferase